MIVEPDTKLLPVKVTFTLPPGGAALGLIEVRVGVSRVTVKLTGLVVPPKVVTVTVAEPDALAAMANVAVICVELTTVTLLTVTPAALTLTVAPGTKLVPVRVTFTLAPGAPVLGLIEVSVVVSGLMVKLTALLVPPAVVTVTLAEPDALAAIANVAVI